MPETLWPIFIPTKNRPKPRTVEALLEGGVHRNEFALVVEPQDYNKYRDFGDALTLMTLRENDKGLVYVRQFILNLAREGGLEWFWMLDDDITSLVEVRDRKNHKTPARTALLEAQKLFLHRGDVGQGALEYQQFAWSAPQPYRLCSYCDVAVAINVKRTGLCNYREYLTLKEDRDFTLQVLSSGFVTMRVTRFGFAVPKNGSNAGGLSPLYAEGGREAEASRRMVETWGPEICKEQTKRDGRRDVKINWKYFTKPAQIRSK